MPPTRVRRPLVALVALVAAAVIGYVTRAVDTRTGPGPGSSSTSVSSGTSTSAGTSSTPSGPGASGMPLASLPPQAAATVRLIRQGGPFPYPDNDGVVFHNDEHLLPAEPDGWYREYTVPTPGSPDRGERRLVVGRDGRVWYTGDHYDSFVRVDVQLDVQH